MSGRDELQETGSQSGEETAQSIKTAAKERH